MSMKKGIAILGATGSVGLKALNIVEAYPDRFDLQVITANKNADLLISQALHHKPNTVVIADESQYKKVREALCNEDVHVYAGIDALCQVLESGEIHTVVNGIYGFSGLRPTIAAIKSRKQIALANKESLVAAGELVTTLAKEHGVNIYPIGSVHSSIFQCLVGEFHNTIEKVFLTTSGGPFNGMTLDQLSRVGNKDFSLIDGQLLSKKEVDCATLIQSGFELIEARWLFNVVPEKIDLIVHKQSVIHGMVQFEDGSMKAQMGQRDLKLPIQFSLSYPERLTAHSARFNFMDYPELNFEKPNRHVFQSIDLAYSAMEKGGTAACILNAANDVAVAAFLKGQIPFIEISKINKATLGSCEVKLKPSYEDYLNADSISREHALNLLK